jgi:fatty acid desaturase
MALMIQKDLSRTRKKAKELGLEKQIASLCEANAWLTPAMVVACWLVVFLSAYAVVQSYYFLPLALLLMGVSQRGLGNLLHDASHSTAHPNRFWNKWLVEFFVAMPSGQRFDIYKANHLRHHKLLGDEQQDLDYIHDSELAEKGAWTVFIKLTMNIRILAGSCLADLQSFSFQIWLPFIVWWTIVLNLFIWLASPAFALTLIALWYVTKLTVFHWITTFREITDHFGLQPGGVYSFTRNAPQTGLLRFFIHPFHNGYHLTHHLYPNVSWYNLPGVHRLLNQIDEYKQACHCDSYFLGKDSVVASWQGKRLMNSEGKG